MPQPQLILFRKPRLDDEYEAVFERAGWCVKSVPVLNFRYKEEELLQSRMHAAGGLIITSPRAGALAGKILGGDGTLLKQWGSRPVVCIGKRSAEPLQEVGLLPQIATHASGKGLAEEVIQIDVDAPWLFVCGNLRRDELPDRLTKAGVAFEELVVYETLARKDLVLDTLDVPDWVVFFSPSGLNTVLPRWPRSWETVQIAAIGKTTAAAIQKAGRLVSAIALKPTPHDLFSALSPQHPITPSLQHPNTP